jgi:hypothetical protein
MERSRSLQGELGVAIATSNIAQGELRNFGTGVEGSGVERRLRFAARRGLQVSLGREASFVFRREDFRAA